MSAQTASIPVTLEIAGLLVHRGDRFSLDVDRLQVAAGQLIALLGPSGVGKSTLMRAVAGVVPRVRGVVKHEELGALPLHEVDEAAQNWRRRVHVVGQGQALLPYLRIDENALVLAADYGLPKNGVLQERLMQTARDFDIDSLLTRYPSQLSGGQYARALLARSLIYEPRVLLLDEISASIDPPLALDIMKRLRDRVVRSGMCAVFVTHYVELARLVADGVIFMRRAGQCLQLSNAAFFCSDDPEISCFRLQGDEESGPES